MAILEELQEAARAVARSAGASVVAIGARPRGNGVVLGEGLVLTNAHNLRGASTTIRLPDGRAVEGSVAGTDWDGDLAVLRADTAGASPVEWGRATPSIGTPVFAASRTPSGEVRVSFGLVSAVAQAFPGPGGRRISGSIEHTAPLPPGSSGSPVLGADGRLVGLNTNRAGEGFYLALPADERLRAAVDALARGETRERPRLGIAVAPPHVAARLRRSVGLPEREGILVRAVEAGSPAAAAGLAEGDLLVSAAGRALADLDTLHEVLRDSGLPLVLGVVRGTEERSITVEAPAGEA